MLLTQTSARQSGVTLTEHPENGGTKEFAAALAGLLRDGDRRRALGREGRQVVTEYFTMEIMCRRHFNYYSALLDGTRKGSEVVA